MAGEVYGPPAPPVVRCDGQWSGCERESVMIGSKGYAYCRPCGVSRRGGSSSERTRLMTRAELRTIRAGLPLAAY